MISIGVSFAFLYIYIYYSYTSSDITESLLALTMQMEVVKMIFNFMYMWYAAQSPILKHSECTLFWIEYMIVHTQWTLGHHHRTRNRPTLTVTGKCSFWNISCKEFIFRILHTYHIIYINNYLMSKIFRVNNFRICVAIWKLTPKNVVIHGSRRKYTMAVRAPRILCVMLYSIYNTGVIMNSIV